LLRNNKQIDITYGGYKICLKTINKNRIKTKQNKRFTNKKDIGKEEIKNINIFRIHIFSL